MVSVLLRYNPFGIHPEGEEQDGSTTSDAYTSSDAKV